MLLTRQQAHSEAERCLYCFDAPCAQACPVHIDIPKFISMIRGGNVIGAAEVVKTAHALANVCGKVCPEEVFCQPVCNRGKQDAPIQIRELHFFATQFERTRGYSAVRSFPRVGGTIAVIGGGPAGLGCAFEIAKLGYEVHVYDADGLGGVPRSSIPSFRLTDEELRSDLEFLSPFVHLHTMVVDARTFESIRREHDAVFVGVGLGLDKTLGVRGERLPGVFPVLEFLERCKGSGFPDRFAHRVVIVGGGNVSLDAAASAKRAGAREVTLVYRRGANEMKVWKSEVEEAKRGGVHMQYLTNPVEIVGDDHVEGLRCRRTRLLEELDESGRPVPVDVPGSEFVLAADAVVIAIGQRIKSEFVNLFEMTDRGFIKVDESLQTSLRGVFAGGDAISGEGTIVQSVAHGKQAAWAIHELLSRSQRR